MQDPPLSSRSPVPALQGRNSMWTLSSMWIPPSVSVSVNERDEKPRRDCLSVAQECVSGISLETTHEVATNTLPLYWSGIGSRCLEQELLVPYDVPSTAKPTVQGFVAETLPFNMAVCETMPSHSNITKFEAKDATNFLRIQSTNYDALFLAIVHSACYSPSLKGWHEPNMSIFYSNYHLHCQLVCP
jgi:hypothetical protein